MKKNEKKAEMGGREGSLKYVRKDGKRKIWDTLIFIEVEYPYSALSLFRRVLHLLQLPFSIE